MDKIISKNIYQLPFDEKLNLKPRSAKIHKDVVLYRYAADFAMSEGTPVMAALDGIVYNVVDCYTQGGLDESLANSYNFIILQHENGEYTHYVHLRKGCNVSVGKHVKMGEIIAYSGSTGRVTYPHLHFAVLIKAEERVAERNEKWMSIVPQFKVGDSIIQMYSQWIPKS